MEGLKPAWVVTRADLNSAEQENILKAVASLRQPKVDELLSDRYLRNLHKAMFGDVWEWAGTYRLTDPNIGCRWQDIVANVHACVGDVDYWVREATYTPDEIAVRLHHRLVLIHPFPNGNGRHTRQAANYLATALGVGPLTWGASLGLATDALRRRYIDALQVADREDDLSLLIEFAKS
jgi:Fic-DOC domain mobile mystery protein B